MASKNTDEQVDNEVKLIRGLQKSDKNSFSKLFHTYYSDLCRFTMQYTNAPDAAEDIVQDIFLSIWRRRKSLTLEGSIKSYLYKSARNSALNYLRHKKIERKWAEEKKSKTDTIRLYDESPEKKIRDRENFNEIENAIEEAIDELPERRKLIFSLSRDDGLTYKEIAEVLDISTRTVETQIRRSKKTIRELMAKYLSIITFLVT